MHGTQILRLTGVVELNERAAMETSEIRSAEDRAVKAKAAQRELRRLQRQEAQDRIAAGIPATEDDLDDASVGSADTATSEVSSLPGSVDEVAWVDRSAKPWVGPPEFMSAVTIFPNPNPLPPYVACSPCLPLLTNEEAQAGRRQVRRLSLHMATVPGGVDGAMRELMPAGMLLSR